MAVPLPPRMMLRGPLVVENSCTEHVLFVNLLHKTWISQTTNIFSYFPLAVIGEAGGFDSLLTHSFITSQQRWSLFLYWGWVHKRLLLACVPVALNNLQSRVLTAVKGTTSRKLLQPWSPHHPFFADEWLHGCVPWCSAADRPGDEKNCWEKPVGDSTDGVRQCELLPEHLL